MGLERRFYRRRKEATQHCFYTLFTDGKLKIISDYSYTELLTILEGNKFLSFSYDLIILIIRDADAKNNIACKSTIV